MVHEEVCIFEFIYLFYSYIHVYFQLVAFVRERICCALLIGYSMRLELTRVCSLNDYQLVMCWYRSLPLFFLEWVYLSLLYPHLVFDVFCLCVCVLEWFWITLTVIFPLCVWVCVLGIFRVCMCVSVRKLLVTFFLIVFFGVYIYTYKCMFVCVYIYIYMFPAWCFRQWTCLAQGQFYGVFNETWIYFVFVVWMVFTSWCFFFMNTGPSFFLESVPYFISNWLLIFSTLCVCVCVCVCLCVGVVSNFTYSYYFSVCVNVFLEIFWVCIYIYIYTNLSRLSIYIYIYIYRHVYFHLCMCRIHVLFNFGLNLSIKFFSFIWSNV